MQEKSTFLNRTANFLKDTNFRTFALLFAIIYFAQMYGKFGWIISMTMFPNNTVIAVTSAIIFALFAGTGTTATIVHNRQEDAMISKELLFFDVVISALFYGDIAHAFWQEGKYGSMASIIFFAVYTSRVLYFLSEQFRNSNVEDNRLEQAKRQTNELLTNLSNGLGLTFPTLTPTLEELSEAVQNRFATMVAERHTLTKDNEALANVTKSLETVTKNHEAVTKEAKDKADMIARLIDKQRELEAVTEMERERANDLQAQLDEKTRIRSEASRKAAVTAKQKREEEELTNISADALPTNGKH